MTIRVEGARIYLGVPGNGEAELIAISENRFYVRESDTEFTFYKNASGEVDRMVLTKLSGTYEAQKIP